MRDGTKEKQEAERDTENNCNLLGDHQGTTQHEIELAGKVQIASVFTNKTTLFKSHTFQQICVFNSWMSLLT